ncbi:ribosomal protein S12 methylthiotransferase RimO [Actinorhabdospora filicis]|uniref:Ribosomal protein uS12 methylthiotransferase RimO n=1 Tax=Actinorhabdospora filicis TaxID=1785913 RepID=A0A9W6SMQ1_9ACTN|nr:30S ribosomal protein S12 methylthiotransferase RimO [Actinorhabdospora filicis]GLZ78654.1 ribosomal protein S12 methylthiotransferase RimO [Actinorhabdospora filicis]
MSVPATRRVALLTLGCARNEVDSEELAARLAADGWELTDDSDQADVVMVNTCGFVEAAKQESVDTLLAAADTGAKVVAAGCMAERYGNQLAESLPEADAVLSFDDYPEISARLQAILNGASPDAHVPRDRRELLPITPVARPAAAAIVPGHGDRDAEGLPAHLKVLRKRLTGGPVAHVKIASGCDRRCTFCAIPSFRGAFVSRRPEDILAEAAWLASEGVGEISLVSENTTSYGKDLGEQGLLDRLIRDLAAIDGVERVRASYLQPAELRPSLVKTIAATPGVAPYFDLSFQHASESVLRRMRRFGSVESFLQLCEQIRGFAPEAGIRTNVIVGFPGETEEEFGELLEFLTEARLDAVGVFGYSDEDGTEAANLPGKLDEDVIAERVEIVSELVDDIAAQRAADRIGQEVRVLVELIEEDEDGETVIEGRAAHQAPEVDGTTTLVGDVDGLKPGDFVTATVVDSLGVDIVAKVETSAHE